VGVVQVALTPPRRRLPVFRIDPLRYPAQLLELQIAGPGPPLLSELLDDRMTCPGRPGTACQDPAGIAQEVYALLACYQILRIAITDAIEAAGGTDPDRASFTIALNAARDLLIQAAGVIADTVIDLTGGIGRRVLGSLFPARRLRVSPRIVKRALSRYPAKVPNITRRS
jgi:hypothetical protein